MNLAVAPGSTGVDSGQQTWVLVSASAGWPATCPCPVALAVFVLALLVLVGLSWWPSLSLRACRSACRVGLPLGVLGPGRLSAPRVRALPPPNSFRRPP